MTTLTAFLAGEPVAYHSFSGEPVTAAFGRPPGYPLTALTIRNAAGRLLIERPMTAGEAESFYRQLETEVA